jgi:hypothetical protein
MSLFRSLLSICILSLGVAAGLSPAVSGAAKPDATPHSLVENFNREFRGDGALASTVSTNDPAVGFACGEFRYTWGENRGYPVEKRLWNPRAIPASGPGTVKLWVRGDSSTNHLQIILWQYRPHTDEHGNRHYPDQREIIPETLILDFEGWREYAWHIDGPPPGHRIFLRTVRLHPRGRPDSCFALDDVRFVPDSGTIPAAFDMDVADSDGRPMGWIDLRNFTREEIRCRIRLSLVDRNENPVGSLDEEVVLNPGDSLERLLDAAPPDLSPFTPPYRAQGDAMSSDVPSAATRLDRQVVVPNACTAFELFADVAGSWGTRSCDAANEIWRYTESEAYRFSPYPPDSSTVRRVPIDPAASNAPAAPFALQVESRGPGAVFNYRPMATRYLPGDAVRCGIWVRGDGSGAPLHAVFHDFSDMADYWSGGWKRVHDEPLLCRLDFDDWRFIEVDLPGGGILQHTPKGSTPDVDGPIELAGFRIGRIPPRPVPEGATEAPPAPESVAVAFGPIVAFTQQPASEAQALFLGADSPDLFWAECGEAHAVVQNGSLAKTRDFRFIWSLRDAAGASFASGETTLSLAPGEIRLLPVDLRPHADAAAATTGPIALRATFAPVIDASAGIERELVFARPDSRHLQGDFEDDSGVLLLEASGTPKRSEEAALRPRRVASPVHSGTGALAIPWSTNAPTAFVSIPPDLPGEPVRLSLWLHGDGSGARFFPAVADQVGISKGVTHGSWDFLNVRGADGGSPVVAVDWTGWKQLEFLLPPIPGDRSSAITIESFVPSYPLGLHLAAMPPLSASAASGELVVDDIRVETHLPAGQRTGVAFAEPSESNLREPGSPLSVRVWNDDAVRRTVSFSGGIYDWRGRRVAGRDETVELDPCTKVELPLVESLPEGVYQARLRMGADAASSASLVRDLVVAPAESLLGPDAEERLRDPWTLRAPVGCLFELVDDDWDWIEYYPGNYQDVTSRRRIQVVADRGGAPWFLLGYCAYWAAGEGYEGVQANAFHRRQRDIGHGVDVFMTPERLEDWDSYVRNVIRNLSDDVAGWILWNSPDAPGPLHVEAGRLAGMLGRIGYWRRFYDSKPPLLLGGLTPETGVDYLEVLCASNALDCVDGVQLRLDPGRSSPEDSRLVAQASAIRDAMGTNALGETKSLYMPELDWAVEHEGPGSLDVMEQAAYLARVALLFGAEGFATEPTLFNVDFDRVGFGLLYRTRRLCTPMDVRGEVLQVKPAWVALARLRAALPEGLRPEAILDLADTRVGRTRCHLFRQPDGRATAAVWRTEGQAWLDFTPTGKAPVESVDLLGSAALRDDSDRYAIGAMPLLFHFAAEGAAAEDLVAALRLARLSEMDGSQSWAQRILGVWEGADDARVATKGAVPARFQGLDFLGDPVQADGVAFAPGGSEHFDVPVPAGQGLLLRADWWLDGPNPESTAGEFFDGQTIELFADDTPVGVLDLHRTDPVLSGGLRGAWIAIPPDPVPGKETVRIRMAYPEGGNRVRWTACAWSADEPLPLAALAPVHADQPVEAPRLDRNVIGGPLQIDTTHYDTGIGVFAPSLLEYALDGAARRFRAEVGIDAATEGKGSVTFEIAIDGDKAWDSGPVSGLDAPKSVDLAIPAGAKRLRLTVTDGGDGNRFDAADWANPRIEAE